MRYLRIGLLIAFGIGLLVVPNGIRLAASDSDVVQQMKDKHEIEAVMWKYARALDSFDPETYASVYTPDGQFGAGENATTAGQRHTEPLSSRTSSTSPNRMGCHCPRQRMP